MIESASRFYSAQREVLGKVCPLDTPFRLAISISEVCNFKCVYCFRSVSDTIKSGYTTKPFMEMDMFKRIVEQAKAFPSPIKKIFLNITGEPLCHKELPQMIRHLKNEIPGPAICIQTNGSLLSCELSKQLADSGLDDMLISLQGISSKKYKEICTADLNFDEFINNIRYLYTIKGSNMKLYVKVPDIALEEGEESKYYNIFGPITDQATIEKINPVFNEVDYAKLGIDSNSTANRIGTDFGRQEVCSIAFYGLSVTTNGNVYPCVQSIVPCTFGNVMEQSLKDIWNGNKRSSFLKAMLRRESIPRCDNCTSKHACVLSPEDSLTPYADEVLGRILARERGV
jgi:radical SAM protein with 4Fe4S-binding SPASM domain